MIQEIIKTIIIGLFLGIEFGILILLGLAFWKAIK